ncbi:MAG: GDCCVxC domain-containing (seleno)protein [Pyrinomonadaceae bacterium]
MTETNESTIECPKCGFQTTEEMPSDRCIFYWECPNCKALFKPLPGDCCVFCSYGTFTCPPMSADPDCCRTTNIVQRITAPGQAYTADVSALKAQFNSDKGKVRLIVLLSPTCDLCLHGASVIQKVLNDLSMEVKVYATWVPILASDAQTTVERAAKTLSASRTTHYWDRDAELVTNFVPVLGLGNRPAWDVYMCYGRDAEWTDSPPKPDFWQEQLGISDETRLDAEKLTAEINKLLTAGVISRNAVAEAI